MYIYIYVLYTHTHNIHKMGGWGGAQDKNNTPVSVKQTALHVKIMISLRRQTFRVPNQGLESSFRCLFARPRLAEKECSFHRHR